MSLRAHFGERIELYERTMKEFLTLSRVAKAKNAPPSLLAGG